MQIKTIHILHTAIGASLITITAVIVFLRSSEGAPLPDDELNDLFTMVVPLLYVGAMFGGTLFYRNAIKRASYLPNVRLKLNVYRSSVIIRDAFMEGAGITGAVAYYFTNEPVYLVIPGFMILMFGLFMPSAARFKKDLVVSDEEFYNA